MRVVAFATKTLSESDLSASRESVEKNLTFTGLLWMENNVKEVSPIVIQDLQTNLIKSMMATGDNILTAISVAQQCNLIDG